MRFGFVNELLQSGLVIKGVTDIADEKSAKPYGTT
jgi:hypothetical protein